MSTFQQANSRGKVGEAIVKAWLEYRDWLVIDCSDHPLFQRKDIDMVIARGRKVRCIDVKTDSYTTGNFYIETVSNNVKGTQGCIYQTEADDWFYYYSASQTLKVFSPADMRVYIESKACQYNKRTKAASYIGNNIAYHSEGILVPNDCPVVKASYDLSKFITEIY